MGRLRRQPPVWTRGVGRTCTLVLLLTALGSAPSLAGAGPTVENLTATVTAEGVVVSGRAVFGAPVGAEVATDPAGDAAVPNIGADLTGASIQPVEDALRFTLAVADPMTEFSAAPETVHYTWPFIIDDHTGRHEYELQAIRTATAQDVRDGRTPGGAPVFAVLGCTVNASGGAKSCKQLSRVNGRFTATGVELTVPSSLIKVGRGASIAPVEGTINTSVGASGLGWASGGRGGDAIGGTPADYSLGSVDISIVAADGTPGADARAEVAGDGTFSVLLPRPKTQGLHRVALAVCEQMTCAEISMDVQVAPTDPFDPILTTRQVYFHCPTSSRVGNVAAAQEEAGSWNDTRPTGAFGPEGCASVDPPARNATTQMSPLDAVWAGTVSGNVDSMTVRAYLRDADANGTLSEMTILPRVSVDGEVRLAPVGGSTVTVPLVSVSPGISKVEFTVTNLDFNSAKDHEKTHDVIFSLDAYNISQAAVWLWDAAEVPSGIEFNPAAPKPAAVAAPPR
jgi:hypothetical protein